MTSIKVVTLYSILFLLVASAATQVAAQGIYVEMPNMPDSRMVFHAGLHKGNICCALGVSNWPDPSTVPPPEYVAYQVYRVDESSGDWFIEEGPAFYGIMSYAAVIDDFLYSAGGAKLGGWIKDSVFRYNLATGEEDTLASLPRALVTGQAFNDNGKFHLMGGHNGGSPDPANLVYDPSTDMWSAEPSLPGGLERHALANIGNKVYLIGGRGLGGYPQSNINLIYDLDTKTYSYGATLPVAIKDAGCAVLDGEIYVFGGWTETPSKHAVDFVQIYNPTNDTWRFGIPLPQPNVGMRAVTKGGAIYLVGGWNLIGATDKVYKYYCPGSISGQVMSESTGFLGVSVDLYDSEGILAQSTVTDASGSYEFGDLSSGVGYTVGLMVPLGYEAEIDEILVNLGCGETVIGDFALKPLETVGKARGTGYWKHQVGVAAGGVGDANFTPEQLCSLLDLIADHFNANGLNQVILYAPPESDLCVDKLAVASDLLNLKGNVALRIQAQQNLMALLFNVAAGYIHQQAVISTDGATVSQAITYCDNVIDNPEGDHNLVIYICNELNHSRTLDAGMIPLNTLNIVYKQLPLTFALAQNNPNPFNPTTEISFSLPNACHVNLEIFNINGQKVASLVNRHLEAGYHSVSWDGTMAASGVYLYRLQAGDFVESKKMVLVK